MSEDEGKNGDVDAPHQSVTTGTDRDGRLLGKVRDRKILLPIILLIGFLLRLLPAIFAPDELPNFRDGEHYWTIAKSVANDFTYQDSVGFWRREPLYTDVGPTSFYLPGYPFFLALSISLFGESFRAAFILQAVLGTLAIAVCYLCARLVFGETVALMAASLQAINPYKIDQVVQIASEGFACLLLLLSMYFLIRVRRDGVLRPTNPNLNLLAITLAVGVLTRSVFLPIAAAMWLFLLFDQYWSTRSVYHTLRALSLPTFVAALCVSPWFIRNYQVWNQLVYNTKSGLVMRIAYHPNAEPAKESPFLVPRIEQSERNELERDRYLKAEAWSWIKENPGRALYLATMRVTVFWQPIAEARGMKLLVGTAWSTLFLLLAWIGMLRCLRHFKTHYYLLIIPLVFTLTHAITLANNRYRVPLDGTLAIFAAWGLWTIYQLLQSAHGRPSGLRLALR